MFCSKCGAQIEPGDRFCGVCGQPVGTFNGDQGTSRITQTPQNSYVSPHTQTGNRNTVQNYPNKPKNTGKVLAIIGAAVLGICMLIALIIGGKWMIDSRAYQSYMEDGDHYLEQMEYEKAIVAYLDALDIQPKSIDANLGVADAYVHVGDFDLAQEHLEEIDLKSGDERSDRYDRLCELAYFEPHIVEIDSSAFPTIAVSFSQRSDLMPDIENFAFYENDVELEVINVDYSGDSTLVTYYGTESEVSDEFREFYMKITVDGVVYEEVGEYYTPTLVEADISLVSTDVSDYPTVRAYVRVADAQRGENVHDLTEHSFTISERLRGGEYLSREVKSATPLKNNEGLNINLVADKSDSISYNDMAKIKNVMTEFVYSLQYEVGDKAELLAFDSIVQQMCYYTNDVNLLVNGINSMSTDGLTAFYDAVYDGITHSALQGGARCVIAFTDGMDNESIHNANEVINYALQKQVPVYIIGVSSSVDEYTLEYMANATGGSYWYIDDLYDLEMIFNQIYSNQKDLYVVEYESDGALDSYQSRDLAIKVVGNGYRGNQTTNFTPVPSLKDNGGVNRTSRYEVIKESLTWQQASQRCQEMGGHLATITSAQEMNELVAMAKAAGLKYIWLGGYTSYDDYGNVFGHWVTGEKFSYEAWSVGEPSRVDKDGTPEWYIMLWDVPELGGWTWNDERNNPVEVSPKMAEAMGFICEFEN